MSRCKPKIRKATPFQQQIFCFSIHLCTTVLVCTTEKFLQILIWKGMSTMNSMKLVTPLRLFHEKRLQLMLWHHNARVKSHQRWKQMRFCICFHLWCELTSTMNVTEWQQWAGGKTFSSSQTVLGNHGEPHPLRTIEPLVGTLGRQTKHLSSPLLCVVLQCHFVLGSVEMDRVD